MEIWVWVWMLIVLKLPLIGACWLIWRAIRQTGDQVVGGEGSGGTGVRYDPGPRTRGPHDGRPLERSRGSRRSRGGESDRRSPDTHSLPRGHVPVAD